MENTKRKSFYTEATELTEKDRMKIIIPSDSYLSYLRFLCVKTLIFSLLRLLRFFEAKKVPANSN